MCQGDKHKNDQFSVLKVTEGNQQWHYIKNTCHKEYYLCGSFITLWKSAQCCQFWGLRCYTILKCSCSLCSNTLQVSFPWWSSLSSQQPSLHLNIDINILLSLHPNSWGRINLTYVYTSEATFLQLCLIPLRNLLHATCKLVTITVVHK